MILDGAYSPWSLYYQHSPHAIRCAIMGVDYQFRHTNSIVDEKDGDSAEREYRSFCVIFLWAGVCHSRHSRDQCQCLNWTFDDYALVG
jgi:hypothetical protein